MSSAFLSDYHHMPVRAGFWDAVALMRFARFVRGYLRFLLDSHNRCVPPPPSAPFTATDRCRRICRADIVETGRDAPVILSRSFCVGALRDTSTYHYPRCLCPIGFATILRSRLPDVSCKNVEPLYEFRLRTRSPNCKATESIHIDFNRHLIDSPINTDLTNAICYSGTFELCHFKIGRSISVSSPRNLLREIIRIEYNIQYAKSKQSSIKYTQNIKIITRKYDPGVPRDDTH